MTRRFVNSVSALGAIGLFAVSGASGAFIAQGTYQLHNHPDGSARPPFYGMRADELFDITGGHDIFTFNFDDAASDMKMTYDGSTIHIFGVALGGRDIGSAYAVEPTTGLYTIDFSYTIGVSGVPGDDDVWVTANMANFGSVQGPVGGPISLVDKSNGDYSFRLGDETGNGGHRGHPGISGWGWLTHHFESQGHIADTDFLFTAELIPAPGAMALMGLVGLRGARRSRR